MVRTLFGGEKGPRGARAGLVSGGVVDKPQLLSRARGRLSGWLAGLYSHLVELVDGAAELLLEVADAAV